MEDRNGKTTVWIPRESFEMVRRLWKPEFNWIPLPVDRSLPPDHIAYIQTNGPVSPLPRMLEAPKTPFSPLSPVHPQTPLPLLTPLVTVRKTPRTPAGLPPLNTASLRLESSDYFGAPPDLETAITAGFSPGTSDRLDTPSTATEPGSPSTPEDAAGSKDLSNPKIWRQSQDHPYDEQAGADAATLEIVRASAQTRPSKTAKSNYATEPWKMHENAGDKWKTVDRRDDYRPVQAGMKPASWKRRSGRRDVKMKEQWQTSRRDEAHWTGSKKGFSVRLDVNLNMEVEIKGFVNGDITLSAEALYAL